MDAHPETASQTKKHLPCYQIIDLSMLTFHQQMQKWNKKHNNSFHPLTEIKKTHLDKIQNSFLKKFDHQS